MEYRELLDGETRTIDGTDDGAHEIEAKVCSYGVGPDTYRTTWRPGCFAEGLRDSLPAVCWGHDSRSVIGSVVSYRDESDGLYVRMRLADFDDVPKAREAYSLIRDGHIKGWSFGYANGVGSPDPQYRGAHQYTKARIFEVSPVLRGSVPLTRTVSVRSAQDGTVETAADEDALARMLASALSTGTRAVTISVGDDGTVSVDGGSPDDGDSGVTDGTDTTDDSDDLTPAAYASAVDAALDAAASLIGANDTSTWPPSAQQLAALVTAAGVAADGLLDAMGVPDPDDDSDDPSARSADDGARAEAELAAAADLDAASTLPDEQGERADSASSAPWSFDASAYTLEQLKRACLIVLGDGSTKDQCKLPIRTPDGTLNRNAVIAAWSVVNGGRGGVDAPPEQVAKAKSTLAGLRKQLGIGDDNNGKRAPSPLELALLAPRR